MTFLELINFDWISMLNFDERPFRAKFIPSKAYKDLDRYRNDIKGLSNYVKKWKTKVVLRTSTRWTKYVAVGGEYEPDDRQCAVIIYCKNFSTHEFTEETWDRFKRRFIETLQHEIIHFSQFDRREGSWSNYSIKYKKSGVFKIDNERNYLASFDEIQAYAHDIYSEYRSSNSQKPLRHFLEDSTAIPRCKSSSLRYYLKTFNYEGEVVDKLFDQVVKWDNKYKRKELNRVG